MGLFDEVKVPELPGGGKGGPGDAAAFLLGGVIGWAGDIILNLHGVPSPGALGAATGSGALGLKKAIEAALTRPRPDRRALKAIHYFREREAFELARQIEQAQKMWREELIDGAALNKEVDDAVAKYRATESSHGDSSD